MRDNGILVTSENVRIQHQVYSQFQERSRHFIPLSSLKSQQAGEGGLGEAQEPPNRIPADHSPRPPYTGLPGGDLRRRREPCETNPRTTPGSWHIQSTLASHAITLLAFLTWHYVPPGLWWIKRECKGTKNLRASLTRTDFLLTFKAPFLPIGVRDFGSGIIWSRLPDKLMQSLN